MRHATLTKTILATANRRVKPSGWVSFGCSSGRNCHGEYYESGYIPRVRELVRQNLRFFLVGAAAAILLRLIFLLYFSSVVNDSFVYGDIAKNWLQHGIYGLGGAGRISPTYIRLPGYPAFLASIFVVFGMEHYRAVLVAQIFVDLGTCLLCADMALRLVGVRAAKAAFLLTALCPFLANYSAAALTETLEIFFTALALDLAIRGLRDIRPGLWVGCGISCAAAMLLRPDGTLLVFVILAYLGWRFVFSGRTGAPHLTRKQIFRAGLLVAVIALAPLVPWTVRNWHVFHRFQPLAPRYANEEGEFVPMGFNRWTKTWIVDYASVEEVYWAVPGSPIDVNQLPSRAFDSAEQRNETTRVIEGYNKVLHVSPELDRQFETIATERIRSSPARYYLRLPLLRIVDMWLRPRTEMLPSDTRWWEFNDEPRWSVLAVSLGVVGLFYVILALAGVAHMHKLAAAGLLILFVVLRSLFLGTLENPEPRYTLEMYPAVIVFAAAMFSKKKAELTPGENRSS